MVWVHVERVKSEDIAHVVELEEGQAELMAKFAPDL